MKPLTSKEVKETIWITIGRLRTAIQEGYPKERQLGLFEKIVKDIEKGRIKTF